MLGPALTGGGPHTTPAGVSEALDSDLFYTWFVPTLDGWNDAEDREVLCVLARQDAALMTGSIRDSNI